MCSIHAGGTKLVQSAGLVAHLVERGIRIAEVRGSSPLKSTKNTCSGKKQVKACFFVYKGDNYGYKSPIMWVCIH